MSARRKILWLSHFLPYPPKGGAQIRSFNLIKELSKYHDVYLFCVADKSKLKAYFTDVELGVCEAEYALRRATKCLEIQWLPQRSSIKKYFTLLHSLFSRKSYSVSLLKGLDVEKLVTFSRLVDFDYVHLDTVALTPFIDCLPPIKMHLNHHNIESEMMLRRSHNESSLFKRIVFKLDAFKIRRTELATAKHLHKHLVCSALDKNRLEKIIPGSEVYVIENGIDFDNENHTESGRRDGALFIGGLDWYPNADAVKFILAEVWPVVMKNDKNLILDVVGKNPTPEIRDLAARYKTVNLHGFVDDIKPFYRTKKLFICPIRDGGGTKLKILDAMANSIPILAHPVAFEGIDAVPNVHYFAASNAEEFAEQIRKISCLADEVLNEMTTRAFLLVRERYDYLSIGRRLADLYR